MKNLFIYVPLVLFFAVILIFYLVIFLLRKHQQLKKRRSPFPQKFLRSPGETLRHKIDDTQQEMQIQLFTATITPLMMYAVYLPFLLIETGNKLLFTTIIMILASGAVCGYSIFKYIRMVRLRRVIRLGYEGELAVGQELNLLMRAGYHVYHDFPADGFNIDHIVIGPAGVFAVETKARAKPTTNNRTLDAEVIYDGHKLQFPQWVETEPLVQTRRQAQWLSNWLQSAVGEKVQVFPVICLPGWFVKRTVKADGILVLNPRLFLAVLKRFSLALTEPVIMRIVHQIDQKCRDYTPRATEGLGGIPAMETPASFPSP